MPGAEHAGNHCQKKEKPGIKRAEQPTISVLESWEQESCERGERRHTVNGTRRRDGGSRVTGEGVGDTRICQEEGTVPPLC